MKEASRLFTKKRRQHHSPSFSSKVNRQAFATKTAASYNPGPGQYEVTLPMVKPKYEAIFKNNRSIIIKVNDTPAPGFSSKEPRFKQRNTISYQATSELQKQMEERDILLSKQNKSKRYNFSLARKKSNESFTNKFWLSESNEEQILGQTKLKGTFWSKYRDQRPKWEKQSNIPGPGAYSYGQKKIEEPLKRNSWQFRSQTKRAFHYNIKNRMKVQELQEQKIHGIHNRNLLK